MANENSENLDEQERDEVLMQLEDWLETPVTILGFVWLGLLVIEFVYGVNPILEVLFYVIWAVFILDFLVRLILAPKKLVYVQNNWLTVLSLALPALRVLRVARVFSSLRLARVLTRLRLSSLVRVIGSLNRGMRALQRSMERRGFNYVLVLTVIVTFVGAAGILAFEAPVNDDFQNYGDAIWWTAMIMTTLGSQAWPQTAEGRVLGFLLSLYAFGVFGYVTAALATFFIGRDAESDQAEIAGAELIQSLKTELTALRLEIQSLQQISPKGQDKSTTS